MKKILLLLLTLTLALSAFSCANGGEGGDDTEKEVEITVGGTKFLDTTEVTNYVKVKFEGFGTVLIELSPDDAPITVKNFQDLVASGFYNGLTIHRIEPGFVIQGGCDSDTAIKGEFAQNGVVNNLSHVRGVISMARTNDPNSATSQFFICLNSTTCVPSLDGRYAGFGWVSFGMDVIDRIAGVDIKSRGDGTNGPVEKVVITSMSFMAPETPLDQNDTTESGTVTE